jgi:PLD-like domain
MQFLTTKQISGEVERVIREAQKFIILISPYIQISESYLERLRDAGNRKVKTHIVFRKDQIYKIKEEAFSNCSNLNLYFFDNLHSKCYLNESSAILTSMNLYEHSERNNREMGISFNRNQYEKLYNEIANECNSIIKTSNQYLLQNHYQLENHNNSVAGLCIRCLTGIEFNPERPLCNKCYSEWSQYFNYDYTERGCHRCGKPEGVSMRKPLCYDCYRELTYL